MTAEAEGPALPVKIDSTSNGEFLPVAVPDRLQAACDRAAERVSDNARRLGLPRRQFMASLCGAATTFVALNEAHAARGNAGGRFAVRPEAAFEPAAAAEDLTSDGLIFDVQTHMVDPQGSWRNNAGRAFERILAWWPQGSCGAPDPTDCYDVDHFIREVFLDSETDLAVLSFVPAPEPYNPLSAKEADNVRRLVDTLDAGHRLLLHGMVLPNLPPPSRQLDAMAEAAAAWPIAAWKVYTQWGPKGRGWALDDPKIGIPFIEQARALGIKNICIHKGLPLRRMSPDFVTCADVGRAAKLFPDVNFIVYHSGFETDRREGPYDPADAARGIDALVKSLADNGIPPNRNVYAELGSTWRMVMRDPTAAAHTLGKLLKHVGEDRVLWGTDSIWYGSPQDQILAFRSFEISAALQDRHGYPALTPAIKVKVFGLNGISVYGLDMADFRRKAETDAVRVARENYRPQSSPSFSTYGPRTRREFLELERLRGGYPD